MKDKDFIDAKVENFVDRHTTPVNPPPGHLPLESKFPEHSNRRNNIPEEPPNRKVPEDFIKEEKPLNESWEDNSPNQDPAS